MIPAKALGNNYFISIKDNIIFIDRYRPTCVSNLHQSLNEVNGACIWNIVLCLIKVQ